MASASQEISKEDLEKLPKTFMVAYAVRNALRVFPLLAIEGHLDFWKGVRKEKKDYRLEHTKNIWKALELSQHFSLTFETAADAYTYASVVAASDASDSSASAASASASASASAAASAASAASAYASSYAYDVSAAAADAVGADIKVKEDALILQQQDYTYLLRLSHTQKEEVVSLDFYKRSLWGSQSSVFQEWCDRLKKTLQDVDKELNSNLIQEVYEPYMKMVNGDSLPTSKELLKHINFSDRKQESPSPLKDSFDRERWAKILAEQLTYQEKQEKRKEKKDAAAESDRGFSIGLFGHWGTGKTGFISFLEKELKKKKTFYTATYNAWEYQDATNYRAVMAQKVWEGIKEGKTRWAGFWLSVAFHLKLAWKRNPLLLSILSLSLLASSVLLVVFKEKFIKLDLWEMIVSIGVALLFYGYSFFKSASSFIDSSSVQKIVTLFSKTNYRQQIGEIAVLREELSLLCQLALKKDHRLLVVIDDLDRCHVACINQILDTVRLLYEVPKVYVLIAVDQRIILQALQTRYEDEELLKSGIGRDFLAKIIEMPIKLKEPKANELESFVNENLFTNVKVVSKEENTPIKSDENNTIESDSTTDEDQNAAETPTGKGESDSLITKDQNKVSEKKEAEEINMWEPEVEERDHFSELIKKYKINNPRTLKRLYNAYGFLYVLLRIGETADNHDRLEQSKVIANVLFHLESKAANKKTEKKEEQQQEEILQERFDKVFSESQTFEEFKETVSCFVLPSL